jgi:DNA (cytosine-5)-methyltransferase 1
MINILNLYAGLGGNRKLWKNCAVTAVEKNPEIARAYADLYPTDNVIVADAHKFLLEHYKEFNFIWSSPPCTTHSQYRYNVGVKGKGFDGVFPDLSLYEEIIFLKYHFVGKYAVENTRSYYPPLIEPQVISRHFIWANFRIPPLTVKSTGIRSKNKISDLESFHGLSLDGYRISNKRQVLRNCVNPLIGDAVFKASNV